MTLPLYILRCDDEHCKVKEYCERWLDKPEPRDWFQVGTLRQGWELNTELCKKSIAIGESHESLDR